MNSRLNCLLHSRNTTKKYNIMAFNAADKVNFATWNQVSLSFWAAGQGHKGAGGCSNQFPEMMVATPII